MLGEYCVSVWRAESSSVCRAVRQSGDCYGNYGAYTNRARQMGRTEGNIMKYETCTHRDRERTLGKPVFILLKTLNKRFANIYTVVF
jgi:hypothetical protein